MASKFEKAFNEMQPEAKHTGAKLERGYKAQHKRSFKRHSSRTGLEAQRTNKRNI